ncbi:NUDIX domain-containing protein [Methylomicrobium sp. Wu6]|uniref:NUDIX domain-containing protein n=1 Tax=Methylomicrobium sp. Wu6 TaxID=3107928 RepID=UPI002DD64F03|nr:NUDIX domain-containing protein [Methylomicrobium sp. Wu6]MEC4748724.1 NUDIX domain-containing protein [Methylomicrobium sp. Wu6]
MNKTFEIISKETGYAGFFRLEKYRLRHTLFAGGWSGEIERELFGRGKCVAVLLYDPERDEVVLIEQFRIGAIGCPERAWLIEIVAGAIEEGETAEDVAYREAEEEAGCLIEELIEVMRFYTSPGGYAEMITLFYGRIDSRQVGGIHGLDHEDEDILVRPVSFAEAWRLLESGAIESAIPILALQWLALNRERLREKWSR